MVDLTASLVSSAATVAAAAAEAMEEEAEEVVVDKKSMDATKFQASLLFVFFLLSFLILSFSSRCSHQSPAYSHILNLHRLTQRIL